ncbi:uncharacterized protein LOC119984632 isoform X1 [Tripterygium wilfordii]|uniref:uncharacterized protein LOC119984632 isoform X1 n=1 Tax=Tripterygium wilfordii TaxID=458696 RepID=UPI0018F862C6|nr:uncharacterized protein LOC119984632 isoform X1 [Tripterygium wilfordii]
MDHKLDAEVKRCYKSDLPPAHFVFKIESFSLLLEAEVEKYETSVFEVGGYKWSLIFYPNGSENADSDDYISLYLVIKETEKLPACWEVNATFRFFVFDHIRDKYLTIEGCKGSIKRFNAVKTEWGFAQFLSLETLKNASTGYLVGDSCIFGAEVFVVKSSCKFETLSMIKYTSNNLLTWKIKDFSKLDREYYESEVFDVEGSKWRLQLYPKGELIAKDAEVKTSYERDLPPAHFMFKIESFSLLLEAELEKYETDVFEVGGYKWSLIFYPNGNKSANADDHISLYLVIKETEKLPARWEVNVTFKFFVFDHIRDKYLTIEGCNGSTKRFHAIKTEWGFAQFLSLDSLKNASTGYLVGDSCIFGAEVFIIKTSCKFECLSMIKHTSNNLMTWKIEGFSKLDKEYYESEVFDVKGSKWKLKLYPKGDRIAKGKSLSLYLSLNETESLARSQRFFVRYKLQIRNQIQDSDHAERIGKAWFCRSGVGWGFMDLISLQDLEKPVKGLIMNDCLMVEAEILYVSEVKSLS